MKWNVDFTLSIHNRTGKYFIGRDIIEDQKDLINDVFAWRIPMRFLKNKIALRTAGRLWHWEVKLRGNVKHHPGKCRPRLPLIHMDPVTVLAGNLRSTDIVICHDIGPLTHPELFSPKVNDLYKLAYIKIAKKAPRMVFMSQSTETNFKSRVSNQISSCVIYPSIRSDVDSGDCQPVSGLNNRFILTVGSLGRRKNQQRAIEAYARSGLYNRHVHYVLCGSHEPGAEEVIQAAGQTPGVHVYNYISDANLRWLYREASGFVLMSKLEGFGVPVVEAIKYGLIPLVTRDSVLEEVAGGGALVANVDSIEEIAAKMNKLLDMSDVERSQRKVQLSSTINRFSRLEFRRRWRDELLQDQCD